MPPIRSVPPIKPMKTERTHEENQERAYVAASRRSDRSLEARIESARRASEIHKKRTGRGLRVTEQDVINEEMYEEEDEDMPSQYQRLSAHIHTNSMMFNRKLQDYIATQAAVRQSFYAQYQNPAFGHYNPSLSPNVANNQFSPGMNPFMHQQMPPPAFNQQPSPTFTQSPQSFGPQSYRSAPYSIPPRPNAHQRSASLSTPQQHGFQQSQVSNNGSSTPQGEEQRRLSLPPQALEQASQRFTESPSRPSLSRSTTSQNLQNLNRSPQRLSPQASHNSPTSAHSTPTIAANSPDNHATMGFHSQMPHSNLFSLSLPPESQQLVAPALDPKDPTTAMFMAGSENIPMPVPTYHYNPNLSPKSSRMQGMGTSGITLSTEPVTTPGSDGAMNTRSAGDGMPLADPSSVMSEDFMFSSMMSNPLSFDLGGQEDMFQSMGLPPGQEEFDPNVFVNFDQS